MSETFTTMHHVLMDIADYFRERRRNAAPGSAEEKRFGVYVSVITDADRILKEQEPREWFYCEDDSGQDGYRCSGCGFFEPWYYNYTNHDFIKKYQFCPSCGATMKERAK